MSDTYEHRWPRDYHPSVVERAHFSERPIFRMTHPDIQCGLNGDADVTIYEGLESVTSRVEFLPDAVRPEGFPVNTTVANLSIGARLCLGQRHRLAPQQGEPGYYRLLCSNYSNYPGPRPHGPTKVSAGVRIPDGAALRHIYRYFGKAMVLFAVVVPADSDTSAIHITKGEPFAWPAIEKKRDPERKRRADAEFAQYRAEAYASGDEDKIAAYERAAAWPQCQFCGDRAHPDFWLNGRCQWCGAVPAEPIEPAARPA